MTDNSTKQIFETLGVYWTSHVIEALKPVVVNSGIKSIDQFRVGIIQLFSKQIFIFESDSGLKKYTLDMHARFGVWGQKIGLQCTLDEFKAAIGMCFIPHAITDIINNSHKMVIYKKALIAILNKFVLVIEQPDIIKQISLDNANTNQTLIRKLIDEFSDICVEIQATFYTELNPNKDEHDIVRNNMSKAVRKLERRNKELMEEIAALKIKVAEANMEITRREKVLEPSKPLGRASSKAPSIALSTVPSITKNKAPTKVPVEIKYKEASSEESSESSSDSSDSSDDDDDDDDDDAASLSENYEH